MASVPLHRRPQGTVAVALASFASMFSVGTVYAVSVFQSELPRLFSISNDRSYVPFGCASLGPAFGVVTCTPLKTLTSARISTAAGAITWGFAVFLAGHFLALHSLEGVLASFLLGGVGVGWTYLAVVVWIADSLPAGSLAQNCNRSSGFSVLDASGLASVLKLGGLGLSTVGLAVVLCVSSGRVSNENQLKGASTHATNEPTQKPHASTTTGKVPFLSTLFFFNALPGMTTFSAYSTTVAYYTHSNEYILIGCLTALALGGVLSPTLLRSQIRPRIIFIALFIARGLCLMAFAYISHPILFVLAIVTVLFGHGVGFSVLPGILKANLAGDESFSAQYGWVLTAWGVAGVVGSLVNAAFMAEAGDFRAVALLLGATTVLFGVLLHSVPSLGGSCFGL
ncbi:major facilitator superfamily domain-containing protein [Aspergillus karnatakaensis]|uniref:major facilitator superfamily domain-containing protein n=1 Tax=Aspergillus karnatakaensis TaxID=1810916 RepID=UPI003CCDE67A